MDALDQLGGSVLGFALCACAGTAGAFAAVCGKLAGQPGVSTLSSVLLYGLLALANAVMLALYSRSLRHNSSLASTAATTAVNISATGLLGRAVFGEATSLQWWAGAVTILIGSFLINRSQKQQPAAAPATAPAGGAEQRAKGKAGAQQALTKLTGEPREALKVQAAGRTDTGVHARGQVAQFRCRRQLAPDSIQRALNSRMPPDIRAVAVEAVAPDFNVRYADSKTYSYDIHLGAVADPFLSRFRHHPRRPERLNLDAMTAAAQLLVGTHNYSNFANVSEDGMRKNPVKTIRRYQLLPLEAGVRLEVEGSGFLYKQVRHMTGALLAVGTGQLPAEAIAAALAAGGEACSGAERHAFRGWMVAEAKGLSCCKPPPAQEPPTPRTMATAPMAKLLPGVAAGFAAAFGVMTFLRTTGEAKLPKSVTNPEWAEATKQLLQSMPRTAGTPIALNPGRDF
ncbi:tRNA pseudouridine synthase A [Chlorella sorokiniana]|uniref:tRNA pseudouridine synthase n=1 Tax=Chlorella sorokiniana TaxID=3076 RepID=A0A2P6TVW2_CHLSO|nr:tRNA pseudouridine synthase A [Chlorella sorokiniana]|eukprot:PRW58196.1 tRNA pseudouridine synthase A [Chlorella sorokiniana]